MARVHNFSAGPAALPTSVLAEIADEMMDYRGCGMSVLEMSHRSSMYQQIIDDAEATLRRLLSIPDNYRVLFLQGGATLQFAGIPMNLMRRGRAGYVVTGNFANKAFKEAAKYDEAVLLASSEDTNFDRIPDMADITARIAFCTGSFMAVRTDVLKEIGGFDPAYFMYVEDADLTQKVLQKGTVWLTPQFSAIHAWHLSLIHI